MMLAKINVGDLHSKITIQRDTSDGTIAPVWANFATLWANKKGLTGRVFYQAAAVQSESDVIYTVRYIAGITAGMQIVDGERIFRIKAPPFDADGRKKWLELRAEEVMTNGG
jgi:SPP1 family predicted phage head-tail adaptor